MATSRGRANGPDDRSRFVRAVAQALVAVGRREPDGRIALVAPVADPATVDRAVRKAA